MTDATTQASNTSLHWVSPSTAIRITLLVLSKVRHHYRIGIGASIIVVGDLSLLQGVRFYLWPLLTMSIKIISTVDDTSLVRPAQDRTHIRPLPHVRVKELG